jgi:hypothetical protein
MPGLGHGCSAGVIARHSEAAALPPRWTVREIGGGVPALAQPPRPDVQADVGLVQSVGVDAESAGSSRQYLAQTQSAAAADRLGVEATLLVDHGLEDAPVPAWGKMLSSGLTDVGVIDRWPQRIGPGSTLCQGSRNGQPNQHAEEEAEAASAVQVWLCQRALHVEAPSRSAASNQQTCAAK